VSLTAAHLLSTVVSSLLATHLNRFGRLGVDDACARLSIPAQASSQSLAQRRVQPLEGPIEPPFSEPLVDGLPGRELVG
jgi:hypothetical protein